MKSKIGTVLILIGAVYLVLTTVHFYQNKSPAIMGLLGACFQPSIFLSAGLLMKALSSRPNMMNNQNGYAKSWLLISILAFYVAITGAIFVMMSFYFQQTLNIRFLIGFGYYFLAVAITGSVVFVKFRNDRAANATGEETKNRIAWVDAAIKILAFCLSAFLVLEGLLIAWKCVQSVSQNPSMPWLGGLFFLASAALAVVMLAKARK